jgi:hypothetical protein
VSGEVLVRGQAGELRASLVHIFTRENIGHSTEAPTIRNMVLSVLALPGVNRVAYLVTRSLVPFFLIDLAGYWVDVLQNPVKIARFNPDMPRASGQGADTGFDAGPGRKAGV